MRSIGDTLQRYYCTMYLPRFNICSKTVLKKNWWWKPVWKKRRENSNAWIDLFCSVIERWTTVEKICISLIVYWWQLLIDRWRSKADGNLLQNRFSFWDLAGDLNLSKKNNYWQMLHIYQRLLKNVVQCVSPQMKVCHHPVAIFWAWLSRYL